MNFGEDTIQSITTRKRLVTRGNVCEREKGREQGKVGESANYDTGLTPLKDRERKGLRRQRFRLQHV